jgi:hypothetical protein
MLSPAVFGISNSGVNLAIDLLILFLVVVWLALVYWTYADARRRIADPMLIGCATAASLFPFVGTLVYMIVRPPEYLDDVRERELEIQAAEARLAEMGFHLCPHCDHEVEKDFLRCPNCMRKLKDPCAVCGKPLDPQWRLCPFCESEVGAPAPAPRRARRRRDGAAERPREVTAERPRASAPERQRDTVVERPRDRASERQRDGLSERQRDAAVSPPRERPSQPQRDGASGRRPATT